jgi:hypothetical protein
LSFDDENLKFLAWQLFRLLFPKSWAYFFTNHLVTLLALSLDQDISLIFWFGNCLGYFFNKIWAYFYQSSGHPCQPV